jgi:hypothetical protein
MQAFACLYCEHFSASASIADQILLLHYVAPLPSQRLDSMLIFENIKKTMKEKRWQRQKRKKNKT